MKTNRTSYKRHEYSGARKSLKRVQAGLKGYHGETSRLKVWRKKLMKNSPLNADNAQNSPLNADNGLNSPLNADIVHDGFKFPVKPKIRTYERKRKEIGFESVFLAPANSCEPIKLPIEIKCCKQTTEDNETTEEEQNYSLSEIINPVDPVIDPNEINCPLLEPKPENLTEEEAQNDGLSGISGYRIVDLKHVIQWSFLMENHRNMCESSRIEFVHENKSGFHSDITFKCSKCDKTWTHSTEKDYKINPLFINTNANELM